MTTEVIFRPLDKHLEFVIAKDERLPPLVDLNGVGTPPFSLVRYAGMNFRDGLPAPIWSLQMYVEFSDEAADDKRLSDLAQHAVEVIKYSDNGLILSVNVIRFANITPYNRDPRLYDGVEILMEDVCVI